MSRVGDPSVTCTSCRFTGHDRESRGTSRYNCTIMWTRRSFSALLVSLTLLVGACTGQRPTLAPPGSTAVASSVPAIATTTTLVTPGSRLVAAAKNSEAAIFDQPDATTKPRVTLSNPNPNGAPLVFLVDRQVGAWYSVFLPVRPNGSKGWVQADQVKVSVDPYRIVVSATKHQLTLYRDGNTVVEQFTVGIGRDQYPTPGGVFYIKELLRPPDPNGAYGPYAYGLSGFTTVKELANFEGGEGTIGIHGTNDPSSIGNSVSHGCVRMRNEDITKLVGILPLGTPVEIEA